MEIIKIWNDKASYNQLEEIGTVIKAGGLVIIPTDTKYAIVGDALNIKVVEKLCRLKGINPEKTNLSIICDGISMASEYSKIDDMGFRFLKQYTPGAFTFLFRAASKLPRAFKGRKVVGIRIPSCEIDRQLAEYIGNPLITTGISHQDDDYAINPGLIAEAYEDKIDLMVEGEDGSVDVSTVIDCTEEQFNVIREGKGKLL